VSEMRSIHCCGCDSLVDARLTDGREIYPHRPDLGDLPFWRCDACGNFVGCHHKSKNRTAPLGCIPTPAIKQARIQIHAILDPLWRSGTLPRKRIYKRLSNVLGWQYHTGLIRSIEEARIVYRLVRDIARENSHA
jgi:hypothetical protein